MAYAAVKGGEAAIDAAHAWLAELRRGDAAIPELDPAQIEAQLGLAVDRVTAEGALADRGLAALALKQACGDSVEAAFLLRAYRTTLPRFGQSEPLDTAAMRVSRRISATFKDLPGGQVLGPTFDYTHRLLDPALAGSATRAEPAPERAADAEALPRIDALLAGDGLLRPEPTDGTPAPDLTREPLSLPAPRALRLQALARGDEGFLLGLGYSTQRGYGNTHPFVGELRVGEVAVEYTPPELGFAIELGELLVTECQMINQSASARGEPPAFTRGYGLTFGRGERRAMAMALVDRALRAEELGELPDGARPAPAADAEFVLTHCDNVQASGFVEHLKLPHYVDFQAELEALRALRRGATPPDAPPGAPE